MASYAQREGVIVASERGILQVKGVRIDGVVMPEYHEWSPSVSPDQKPIKHRQPKPSSPTSSDSEGGPNNGETAG